MKYPHCVLPLSNSASSFKPALQPVIEWKTHHSKEKLLKTQNQRKNVISSFPPLQGFKQSDHMLCTLHYAHNKTQLMAAICGQLLGLHRRKH